MPYESFNHLYMSDVFAHLMLQMTSESLEVKQRRQPNSVKAMVDSFCVKCSKSQLGAFCWNA